MIQAFPLSWPAAYPRTNRPQPGRFSTSFAVARDQIIREIKLLGGRDLIISTNIPVKNDGMPYASFRKPDDAGVAVYFMFKGNQVAFACDKWQKIEDNMQGIRKTIESIRGIERWGVSDMLNRTFQGFKALPEGGSASAENPNGSRWWAILGVDRSDDFGTVKAAWRYKCKVHHPDNGGDPEKFDKIQAAWREYQNTI